MAVHTRYFEQCVQRCTGSRLICKRPPNRCIAILRSARFLSSLFSLSLLFSSPAPSWRRYEHPHNPKVNPKRASRILRSSLLRYRHRYDPSLHAAGDELVEGRGTQLYRDMRDASRCVWSKPSRLPAAQVSPLRRGVDEDAESIVRIAPCVRSSPETDVRGSRRPRCKASVLLGIDGDIRDAQRQVLFQRRPD